MYVYLWDVPEEYLISALVLKYMLDLTTDFLLYIPTQGQNVPVMYIALLVRRGVRV